MLYCSSTDRLHGVPSDNRAAYPISGERCEVSPTRTGSEPSAPLGLGQRPSGSVKTYLVEKNFQLDDFTTSGSVGLVSCTMGPVFSGI